MPDTLGERLRAARTAQGLTQQALADALNIGRGSREISRYETDKLHPRDDRLIALAKTLGVSPGWLRYGEGDA